MEKAMPLQLANLLQFQCPALLSPDGIHPSLHGHKTIVRALVDRLTW
jgi:lysophospholipase L1-like esterase